MLGEPVAVSSSDASDNSRTESHLDATLPAGDGEMLDRLKERCDDVQARSAGASTLATATVPESS